jgi:hypothetical protein
MTTKELIKAEIDSVPEENLDELYELIKNFTQPKSQSGGSRLRRDENDAWNRLNILIDEISAEWPEGVSAQDAINDVRREL